MVDLTDLLGGGSPALTKLTKAGNFCGSSVYRKDLPPYCANVWTLAVTPHPELEGYTLTAVNDNGAILARKIGIPPGPDVLDVGGKLSTLPQAGDRTEYVALNEAGDLIGNTHTSTTDSAFVLRNGQVTMLGAGDTLASAVNARGVVTGFAGNPDGTGAAVLWSDEGVATLPSLGGSFATGVAINESGQVAGFGYFPHMQHAFFWDGHGMVDIGALPMLAGGESWGLSLNDSGDVVGRGRTGAFLYSRGALYDLNKLGDTGGLFLDIAFSIDDDGVILVTAYFPSEIWLPDGAPRHVVALYPRR
jgi:probable HAF family extracellular repeat protein